MTVSPALISSSAAPVPIILPVPSVPAVAFQPRSFKALTTSSTVTNLPFVVTAVGTPPVVVMVPVLGVIVIVSPFASAVISNNLPSLDLTVNLIPPCLSSSCPAVSVAVSVPF